ncbi:MAG: hypothetical protein JWR89_512 [Tardiphaga sp.]|jgi:hypothetical protein|nr:hypothetical protein [Tardiphaga sp.]
MADFTGSGADEIIIPSFSATRARYITAPICHGTNSRSP